MVSNIYIGSVENPLFHFSNAPGYESILTECKADISTDLISSELPIDTLVFSVDGRFAGGTENISPETVPGGTKVFYYYGDTLVGKFYVNRLVKTGKHKWTFECENYIGLLDNKPFYGLYYRAEYGVDFETAVKHVLLSDGIRVFRPCESVSVSNWNRSYLYGYYSGTDITEAHFRYDGLAPGLNESSKLAYRLYFYGRSKSSIEGDSDYRFIWADITRSSTSEKFDDTVTLRFCYGAGGTIYPNGGLELIQVSPGDDVRIKIVPGTSEREGYITVNNHIDILPSFGWGTRGAIPLLCAEESIGGKYTNNNVNLTWYSHKINDEEIIFFENTANGDIFSYRKPTDGSYSLYLDYRAFGIDKRLFSAIVYRAEELYDKNFPFSFPDSTDVEFANALSFEDETNDAIVVGVIPKTTKRDALHQLMFSCGICMKQNANGGFTFSYLLGESTNIPDTSIFDTGDISYDNSVNHLKVTAYETVEADYDPEKLKTAFTNVGSDIVQSEASIVSLGDTPWAIYKNDQGESGTYFTNCLAVFYTGIIKLLGLPCSTVEHNYSWDIANPYGKRSLDVSGCKLITPSNVDAVGEKLVAYYENFAKVSNDIIYSGERCGNKFDITSPFGENITAYLAHMSMTAYGFIRANCEFIANFTPPPSTQGYHNVKLLTGSGTYTLPENIKFPVKIVLIGGGQGGSGGSPGEDGPVLAERGGSGEGGNGGKGGNGGNGGKVYSVTLKDSSVKTFSYSCGAGGEHGYGGSEAENRAGKNGGDTTFGVYSSKFGGFLRNGYEDLVTFNTYGATGESGIDGGKGGGVERYKVMAGTYGFSYTPAEGVDNSVGGDTSSELIVSSKVVSSGAGGGGAAYGKDGGDAVPAYRSSKTVTNADGGHGADAAPPQANLEQTYGSGGLGGDGGGGGGASGTGNASSGYTYIEGSGGIGGHGSNGGDGMDGCVLIYYNTIEAEETFGI